uniref:Uncharacterized protein n=1 Tax=Anguilla anguilla TaxID=7936 RepID=A0A0E9WFW9_ANGAN
MLSFGTDLKRSLQFALESSDVDCLKQASDFQHCNSAHNGGSCNLPVCCVGRAWLQVQGRRKTSFRSSFMFIFCIFSEMCSFVRSVFYSVHSQGLC